MRALGSLVHVTGCMYWPIGGRDKAHFNDRDLRCNKEINNETACVFIFPSTSLTLFLPQSAIDPSRVRVCGNIPLRRLSAEGATHNPEPSSSSLTHTLSSCRAMHTCTSGLSRILTLASLRLRCRRCFCAPVVSLASGKKHYGPLTRHIGNHGA